MTWSESICIALADRILMAGIVSIPFYEPWKLSGWGFRRLLERALLDVSNEDDQFVLTRALALQGLRFQLLAQDQGKRLAQVVEQAASPPRMELWSSDSAEPRDSELADALAALEVHLHDLHEANRWFKYCGRLYRVARGETRSSPRGGWLPAVPRRTYGHLRTRCARRPDRSSMIVPDA
jgi:hypothetical protein